MYLYLYLYLYNSCMQTVVLAKQITGLLLLHSYPATQPYQYSFTKPENTRSMQTHSMCVATRNIHPNVESFLFITLPLVPWQSCKLGKVTREWQPYSAVCKNCPFLNTIILVSVYSINTEFRNSLKVLVLTYCIKFCPFMIYFFQMLPFPVTLSLQRVGTLYLWETPGASIQTGRTGHSVPHSFKRKILAQK